MSLSVDYFSFFYLYITVVIFIDYSDTVNRDILVMVLFWPILAPKYEVPKLNTPEYITLFKN